MEARTRPLGATEPRARTLAVGELVAEWRIVRALAVGGFGAVYEARHAATDRRVALKLLHAHLVASAEIRARFEREVRVIGTLRHPNVVDLVGAGFSADGRPFLCMELLDGEDLTALVLREHGISPAAALAILEPLCDALAAAHAAGIIHRDIKASNVRVCGGGARVVLLDFGIAKLTDALAADLTATNQALGTPACMAPEQVHGGRIDARTDVYALGALLFYMVTARPPFEDASPTMSQYLHLHARRPRASALAPAAARLDDVIIRAMAIEPADRFADVHSLLAAARAATRERTALHAAQAAEAAAILVTARVEGAALDAALLDDLEGVLPAAERFLGTLGYALAVDLGSSAIFVRPDSNAAAAQAAALAVWDALERRPKRDRRVQVGICAHRGSAPALLRTATWRAPDAFEGVWGTGALDASHGDARRIR